MISHRRRKRKTCLVSSVTSKRAKENVKWKSAQFSMLQNSVYSKGRAIDLKVLTEC